MPYIGQIMVFSGNFAPEGWALCVGQLMSIADNQELFQLIGTTYGGDGETDFALPNLQSRVPVGQGQGRGLSACAIGQMFGAESVRLTTAQLPPHGHEARAVNAAGNSPMPAGNTLLSALGGQAASGQFETPAYAEGGNQTALNSATIGAAGSNQPHNNLQPYLAVNFCIALVGQYPQQ
jgi:microcystin-dependent protein